MTNVIYKMLKSLQNAVVSRDIIDKNTFQITDE